MTATLTMEIQLVMLPVADVDRAKAFYTGIGWQRHPDLADVVDNLASDAAIVDNDEFDDVQADAKTRRALIDQHARFKKLMGTQYTELVYETERN